MRPDIESMIPLFAMNNVAAPFPSGLTDTFVEVWNNDLS